MLSHTQPALAFPLKTYFHFSKRSASRDTFMLQWFQKI